MSQRSSVVALAFSFVLLGVGAAGLIGYLHTARAADETSGKLDDAAAKAILPDLQKDIAAEARFKRIRLDDAKIETKDTAKTAAFTGLWLIETEGTVAEQKALHDWIKPRVAALLKKKINAGAKPDPTLDKEIDQLDVDVHGLAFARSPVVTLREQAVGKKELDGVVFTDASYTAAGKLDVAGYVAKDQEAAQTKLIDTLLHKPAVVAAEVLGTKAGQPVEPSLTGLKPIDYTAIKKRAQEEFAAEKAPPILRRTRVDGVAFGYAKALTGAPALVLGWRGVCLDGTGDEKKAALKAALQKAADTLLPKPAPEKFDTDVGGITFRDNPSLALQEKVAADSKLDGLLLEPARFDKDGKVEVPFLGAAGQKATVEQLLKGAGEEATAVPAATDWPRKGATWADVLAVLQAKLAADRNDPLAARTRLTRAWFAYDKSIDNPRLHFQGVSFAKGTADDLAKKLAPIVKVEFPAVAAAAPVAADKVEFKTLPLKELQQAVAADPALDGTVILGAHYDAKGDFRPEGFIAEGGDAKRRLDTLLIDKLKSTGLLAAGADHISLDELTALDWQGFLKGLRKEFAGEKEPLFRQTRVDRAYFAYDDDEPRIHFELIVLQPPGEVGQLRTRLEQRLQTYYAGKVKRPNEQAFKVVVPATAFQVDPTPGLQRLVATDPTLDGALFESAWFDADRHLNFDVIYDNAAGQGDKIKKLFAENEIARKSVKPALLDNDVPKLNPRTFVKWEEQRRALQGVLAASREPLQQRTRIDRLYFTYVGDTTGNRQLKAEGVSLQPGTAADNQKELAKTTQARYQALLPGVEFKVAADGVASLTSPVVGLQAMAVDRHYDDALFEDAVYDAEGRLHLRVYLDDSVKPAQINALVGTPAAREALKPALGKRPGQDREEVDKPQPFPWRKEAAGMVGRFQKGLASSEVRAAQQTRVDRAYFLYDKQAARQLHLEGVSLWDGLPKATLPEALTPVCRDVLAEPAYSVVADKVARKPNPAPGLQDRLGGKPEWDGILFEDARYDALGRLVFPVLINGSEAQRTEVRRLLLAPLAEGILPADPARRDVEIAFHAFDWTGMLKDVRAWAAGAAAPRDARRTRLDRAYFSREDGGCQLQLVGATLLPVPEGEPAAATAVRTRVADSVGKRCVELLRALKLQLPAEPKPLARAVVPARRDLIGALRADVAERRSLDGVNITDVVYDGAGKVAPEGHWIGESQGRELGDLLRDDLRPEDPVISKFGISLERLRVVRTDLVLRDLRKWLVDKTEVEEVLFDRLYFDAAGKLRIDGFFTRPPDQAVAEKAGLDALLAYPVGRGLLGLDPEGIARPAIEGKDVIHLGKRPSLVEHLRRQVPADPALDGLRIDRCWYDGDAAFVLNGLEDAAGQARGLKTLLDAAQQAAAFKGNLPAGWRIGTFTVVPLRKMLRCLQRTMPADPVYDGVALERAYHDAANHLVVTGAIILMDFPGLDNARIKLLNQRRDERARKALDAAIKADPNWRLRLSYGGPDLVLAAAPADLDLAQRAFDRAAHLYGHERKVARALADLDTTIFNNPADATAWYFRAVCELALGDEAAARRDLRRVLAFADGRPPMLGKVIDYSRLELVQGINRATTSQTAGKIALAAPAEKSVGEIIRELCEEHLKAPVLPDEAPGWDRPFVAPKPCRWMPW